MMSIIDPSRELWIIGLLDSINPSIQKSRNPEIHQSKPPSIHLSKLRRGNRRERCASQATAIGPGEFALPNRPKPAQFETSKRPFEVGARSSGPAFHPKGASAHRMIFTFRAALTE